MRPTTVIWTRFESIGKPEFNETHNCTVDEMIRKVIPWVLKAHLGSRIKITIARSEPELGGKRVEDMSEDYFKMFEDLADSLEQVGDE